jgi:hypothetical protein
MLASIAQKRPIPDFSERKIKANGPVPPFVLVIARIPDFYMAIVRLGT